jgi:tetratricopeptide (TPR) repeat protein
MLTDLAKTPIAETLCSLSTARKSGDLQVQSAKAVKTLFFDHGRLVFAASNLRRDRLGEALVALGRITDEQYQKAVALLSGERKRRFGEALVQAGVLEKGEVGRSVARQVKRIVLSVFSFTEGVSSFEERRSAIPLEYMVSLSLHQLLYEGIRTMKTESLVLAGLGNQDRRVKLATVPPFGFSLDDCTDIEREILEQAQRRVSLRRLYWVPGGASFERMRAVYALLASGVIADAEAPEDAPQPIIQMETGTFLLSALQRQPDPSAGEAIRKEVEDELERSAHLDRESWLKVSREAPREELVRALEEKMERYHALLDAAADDTGMKTDLEVILGRASAMLRLARLAPPPPPKPAPAPAPVATAPIAGPAKVARPEAAAPTPPAEEPVGRSSGAPREAQPSRHALPDSAQIEHLLMEGEIRLTVSDYANAIKVYAKLVDLSPDTASFHQRLAIAMASYPPMAKQAEREFLEAVRLEPDNADVHYQFGMYYKIMKQRARALGEMQTAVRLSPRHALARRELETLSPKDSALVSLKRLFRG